MSLLGTVDVDGSNTRRPWYDMGGQDFLRYLLSKGISMTENGRLDVFGLGSHASLDLDGDIRHEVILRGLRKRAYIIVPVMLLDSNVPHNGRPSRQECFFSDQTLILSREPVCLFSEAASSLSD